MGQGLIDGKKRFHPVAKDGYSLLLCSEWLYVTALLPLPIN